MRSVDSFDFMFVPNHSTEPISVDAPQSLEELLGNPPAGGVLTLPRYGVTMLSALRIGAVPVINRIP